jgi:hypothetical protein
MANHAIEAIEGKQERLEQINAALAERNLKLFENTEQLGNADAGTFEIVGIADFLDHNENFYTDVAFLMRTPSGAEFPYPLRINADSVDGVDGAVFIPVINDRVAIVKQWRPGVGTVTHEFPRGFVENNDDEINVGNALDKISIGDLNLGVLQRELGEEVLESARITQVSYLGSANENSSSHRVAPDFYLVNINIDREQLNAKLGGAEELDVELWTWEQVDDERGRKLADMHSLTALALVDRLKGTLS